MWEMLSIESSPYVSSAFHSEDRPIRAVVAM